jgi:hypothetical protein
LSNDAYIPEEGEWELMDYAYNGADNPDQEEASFYFALHEFKSIVEKYGVKKVIHELDGETEERLYRYYVTEAGWLPPAEWLEFPPFFDNVPKVGAGNLQGDGADSKTGAEYKNGISHIAPWLNEEPPF